MAGARPADDGSEPQLRLASIDELEARTLCQILELRTAVFVVEQDCTYQEVDARDYEAATRHVWFEKDGRILAALRVLRDPDGATRIGRVCTHAQARGRGLAARLVRHVCEIETGAVVLDGQSYLQTWYESLGFVATGAEFLDEEGIPHVPMSYQPSA